MSLVADLIDEQLPQGEEVFLDHIGYFVHDLETAGQQLMRLGFQVSLINVQTNADAAGVLHPSGTSNRVVRLRRGYLEVLTATHDTPLADQLRQALARYQGIHLIALSHDDIPAQHERLTAAGFAMQPVISLRRRDRTLPNAPEVAWSVLRPQPGAMPEGRVQFVKSHNPEHVWRNELTVHENGADALTDLLLCVEDRKGTAARYGRYAARTPVHHDDVSVIALDRGRIVFAEAAQAARMLPAGDFPAFPFMAGQAIRSADITATRRLLDERGFVAVFANDELVCIGPADALGSYLLFHAGAVAEPWRALAAR